ncbi:MAG TPA: hypothetical protein VNL70_05530, partial [Tepidisphaeraceae bacterium]|nr:hypothetical protein [Tepidisphaeraceae bacterium]
KFNWLKILPPEGSFCYVAKAYVNRAGNGSVGQVTNTLNVRIGSSLNPLKTKVATRLEPNQMVQIIGEQDEYFKIKPPPGVYLYIAKQFVEPVKKLDGSDQPSPLPPQPAIAEQAAEPAARGQSPDRAGGNEAASEASAASQAQELSVAQGPTTQPLSGELSPPSTQPTVNAEVEFDRLESEYATISQQPLDEQPVEQLLAAYEKLAVAEGLPESLRRICDFKISVLKTRAELKSQYVETRRSQDSLKQKQMALRAEQQELEDRIRQSEVQFFTAVGTLRTSSLQQGQGTLYRLTDPSNGRTVVYLRSDDAKLGQFIGQFIGVKGEVANDAALNLRIITPTEFTVVNPAKLGTGIAAQIVPPSLMPGSGGTASAGTE